MKASELRTLVFALVRPPSKFLSTFRPRTLAELDSLLERARTEGLLLYSAAVEQRPDGVYALPPWRLDERSLAAEQPAVEEGGLTCPYCSYIPKSTSGRTLHMKAKHPNEC